MTPVLPSLVRPPALRDRLNLMLIAVESKLFPIELLHQGAPSWDTFRRGDGP
jgi:hypothetical protein